MVAERTARNGRRQDGKPERQDGQDGQSGQSLLEFLLMLPLMIGLVLILVRVNTAIQVSIVNQQYARMHALWLAFNSPSYPNLNLRERQITRKKDNQMVIGVSDNAPDGQGEYTPAAATAYIARKKGAPDSDDKEADKRALVRIRDTVTICTQPNLVTTAAGLQPVLPLDPETLRATGPYNLSEEPRQFQYCSSNMKYITSSEEGT